MAMICMHNAICVDTQTSIHRGKKGGEMSILPECNAVMKKEYLGKDDKSQS